MIKRSFGDDFWRGKFGMKQEPLSILRDELERIFASVNNWASGLRGVTPRVDLIASDDGVEIEAELPGVDQNQIDVTLSGSNLIISGEKQAGRTETERRYGLSERSYGRFSRSVALPFEPDADSVTASFRNGVLHIRVPKPEHLKPKSHKVHITP